MCSNNTSSGSYGDLQQDNYIGSGSGSCPKRQKNNKVRRRGPGVAELEKIRLQQLHKSSIPNIVDFHSLFAPPPSKMNLHNPSSGVGRYYQFIEPPSNQRSCINNVSQFIDEENQKMLNAKKRPWHLLTDTPKPSFSNVCMLREEGIQNRSMGVSPVQDSGTTMSNPITIDSPTSIPSFPHHYPKFIPIGLQYEQQQQQQQQLQQQQDFDENEKWRHKKPFYSFISSDDRSKDDQGQRPCDRYESAADHEIDLSLKL